MKRTFELALCWTMAAVFAAAVTACGATSVTSGSSQGPGSSMDWAAEVDVTQPDSAADTAKLDSQSPAEDVTEDDVTAGDVLGGDVTEDDISAALADAMDGAASDAGQAPCQCPTGQALADGACVATTALGCAPVCTPGGCVQAQVCDPLAGTSCGGGGPAAVCVQSLAMKFQPGALRVQPTAVAVGAKVTVTVEGGPFYIGALWWVIRIGAFESGPAEGAKVNCQLNTPWTAKEAGVFAVEASYGSSGPNATLAGFITVGGAGGGVQPGYSCQTSSDCLSGGGWSCGCASGVCLCEKP